MKQTLKATLRYDGTAFSGWQVQPGQRTVQGVIEEALSTMAQAPVRVHGAGRTDAGVHALGQACSWEWEGAMPPERVRRSLSCMLAPEVRVEEVAIASADFHARFSARAKRYVYTLELGKEQDPFSARYAWLVAPELDLSLLAQAAQALVGEHDFAGYQGGGASAGATVRAIYGIGLKQGGVIGPCDADSLWRLEFHGNGFLYKMVRNITGTLVDIARGHLPPARVRDLLDSPGPYHGNTAPAHGLALAEVIY